MVGDNGETMIEEVLVPLFDHLGDSKELLYICGRREERCAAGFAEEGDEVSFLLEDHTYFHVGGIHLNSER